MGMEVLKKKKKKHDIEKVPPYLRFSNSLSLENPHALSGSKKNTHKRKK